MNVKYKKAIIKRTAFIIIIRMIDVGKDIIILAKFAKK
jgi:hypothetical protein